MSVVHPAVDEAHVEEVEVHYHNFVGVVHEPVGIYILLFTCILQSNTILQLFKLL